MRYLYAKGDWVREILQRLDDGKRDNLRRPRIGSGLFAHHINFNFARRTCVIDMERNRLAIRDELHHRLVEACSCHREHCEYVRILNTHAMDDRRNTKRQVFGQFGRRFTQSRSHSEQCDM